MEFKMKIKTIKDTKNLPVSNVGTCIKKVNCPFLYQFWQLLQITP